MALGIGPVSISRSISKPWIWNRGPVPGLSPKYLKCNICDINVLFLHNIMSIFLKAGQAIERLKAKVRMNLVQPVVHFGWTVISAWEHNYVISRLKAKWIVKKKISHIWSVLPCLFRSTILTWLNVLTVQIQFVYFFSSIVPLSRSLRKCRLKWF